MGVLEFLGEAETVIVEWVTVTHEDRSGRVAGEGLGRGEDWTDEGASLGVELSRTEVGLCTEFE